ncbi:unnamed protein product, partial [Urochloa humidicola]
CVKSLKDILRTAVWHSAWSLASLERSQTFLGESIYYVTQEVSKWRRDQDYSYSCCTIMLAMKISNMNLSTAGETMHRHINAVFDIIPALTYQFVKPATGIGTHWKISTDPRFFSHFENCLGVIDGTHVPITMSEDKQAPWITRKLLLYYRYIYLCGQCAEGPSWS